MLFNILQLLLLLLSFCCLAALTTNRLLRGVIALLGAVVMAAEMTSVLIGSSLIDYKFYAHFKLSVATAVGGFFFWQVVGVAVVTLLSVWLIYQGSQRLGRWISKQWPLFIGAVLSMALLFVPDGIGANIASITSIHFSREKAFSEALEKSGIENYTLKKDLKGKPGKNIIAIFMESLEIGYLQEELAHLTPNMNRMKEEMNFYPMTQNPGGNYTIGALYTYMTGIPMYFKNHGNNVFEEVIEYELSSVPAVLQKAGYHQEYLAGNPEFAGMDVMWDLMGVEVKSEDDYDISYDIQWGMHDLDLFQIADKELDRLYAQDQPFAYYISTISTHATDGVPDRRVEAAYPPQNTQLELMALALDDYIGKMVDKLSANGQLNNTAIYILPDHLLLSNYSRVLDDFEDKRELFLLTNTPSQRFKKNEQINQAHIPQMILEGAGVENNLVTIADQYTGEVLEKVLADQKLALLQLNEAALTREEKRDEIISALDEEIEVNPQTLQFTSRVPRTEDNVKKGAYIFIGTEKLPIGEGVNLVSKIVQGYQLDSFNTNASPELADELLEKLAQVRNEDIESWLLFNGSVGEALKARQDKFTTLGFPELGKQQGARSYLAYHSLGYVSERSSKYTLKETFPNPPWKTSRSQEQLLKDAKDPDKWIAHAGGMVDGIDYCNFKEALDESYARGYRIFELDIIETTDGKYVAAHDWKHWKSRARYKLKVPVSHEVFMNTKIVEKYTPMDMAAINKWFGEHKDAILVSDKVNNPKRFAAEFIDKDRLMMELFSFSAVKEAREIGIREILLTERLWHELPGDRIGALEEKGIGGLAISIKSIVSNPAEFKAIKEAGIKTYVFHVGGHGLKDEAFMARYGLDLAYGLYADDWYLR